MTDINNLFFEGQCKREQSQARLDYAECSLNSIFYQLIQVAIGNRVCLSRTPKIAEWMQLYDIAKKQSLVGICFAGVQKLQAQRQAPNSWGDERGEMLYLQWMGMAAKIQQRNEVVNKQCVKVQRMLAEAGFNSSILKGQGVAQLYPENLAALRQSGDIDVLMWKDGLSVKENRDEVMEWARTLDEKASGSEHHVHVDIFKDTAVELHYEPSYFCNPFANRRFRRWTEEYRGNVEKLQMKEGKICVPSLEFNIVFLLSHVFRHYVSEGVGMRQMMDYYFVLRTQINGERLRINDDLLRLLDSFNMLKFARAVMWVLKEVFGLERECMICESNERLGRKLLRHIMQGGNFGHHNKEKVVCGDSHLDNFVNQLAHDLHLAVDYPSEALWSPLSMIREFLRIRI